MVVEFLNPKQIIQQRLHPTNNMLAADFGCGSGEWTVPLAQILEFGKVYAIDLLDEPLSVLRGKIRDKKLFNLEIVKSDVEKTISRVMSNSLDLVLMTNLLFQIKDKKTLLEEARRMLKPQSRILIIEWSPDSNGGPDNKINPQEIKDLAAQLNFKIIDEFAAGSFHNGMILEKIN